MSQPRGSRPPLAASALPNIRPRDAAALIVLRRDPDATRVMMGHRSGGHVFMPGALVFPGGRVDRADRYAPAADALHPAVEAKLLSGLRSPDPRRARALALAAIRETFEETGLMIGRPAVPPSRPPGPAWAAFPRAGLLPTLAPLRLVARAITPPRHVRRFDARFFAVFADAVAAEVDLPDGELNGRGWFTFEEARRSAIPWITGLVLDGLEARLAEQPALPPDCAVPFHLTRHGRPCLEYL